MNDTKESEPKVSGFHTIAAYRFHGFNEKILRDFEKMLANFRKSHDFTEVREFLKDVDYHINRDPVAHKLIISDFIDDIVTTLYHTYRDTGYDGSIKDMFLKIYNEVEVASIPDCLASWSTTMAVPVPGWLAMFERHETKEKVHEHFTHAIIPDDAANVSPNLSLNSLVYSDTDIPPGTPVRIANWRDEGTICLDVIFNCTSQLGEYSFKRPLITLTDENNKVIDLTFSSERKGGKYTNVFALERDDTVIAHLPISRFGYGVYKVVITYARRHMALRDSLNGVLTDNPFKDKITILQLRVPIDSTPTIDVPCCSVREISQYNIVMTKEQQIAFIN